MSNGTAVSNPFSTARIRPGEIPFRFSHGDTVPGILARWQNTGCRGQIIGPHGSGKSTLLHALQAALSEQGWHLQAWVVREGVLLPVNGSTAADAVDATSSASSSRASADGPAERQRTAVLIDGFEQLGWLRGWWWRLRTRCQGAGLIVTAHRPLGLPTIYATEVDRGTARAIVGRLLGDDSTLADEEIEELLACHGANLRDALFALYDRYELRRRKH